MVGVDARHLQISSKYNRMQRGEIPIGANHLTMFVDVQASLLFYVVAAWESDFTGYIVDYGAYPDQQRPYFTLRDARSTLASTSNSVGLEGSIYAGLEVLINKQLSREWRRDDGAALRIDRCLIDANWGLSTDVIYQFSRQSLHAGIVMPSHGRFVGASIHIDLYRLIGKDQYELVAPGGELKHGNLGNESYSNRADTYGLMMAVDRRDIINDDLGAITTVPRKLGRGSGLKINDVFWTVFLANSGFFTIGNKNFLSGTDTVLSIDGLTKAEVAYYDLVDSDGKPIGTMPAIMLVPTALSAIGSQLYKSLEMRDSTANARVPITNPHVGKFRVEVSRYLANALYTGNSSKAWYLLTDPNDLPLIEVAFLNGQEAPTIETADADFNVLGVQMRGYHDFGVALQDPRAAIKCKGEA